MKIARKLRDALLARYTEMRQNPNGIKAFQTMSVTETGVFQDRLVMTASISLRILFCRARLLSRDRLRKAAARCARSGAFVTQSISQIPCVVKDFLPARARSAVRSVSLIESAEGDFREVCGAGGETYARGESVPRVRGDM